MAALGLRFCARAFSSCGKRGPLFIVVRGTLTIAASPVAEHRLQTRRLSNCGSRAQPLRGMWDLPRPGLEPASPASASRLSTTAPPGKPFFYFLKIVQYFATVCWHEKPVPSVFPTNPFLTLFSASPYSNNEFFKDSRGIEEARWLNKNCLYTYQPILWCTWVQSNLKGPSSSPMLHP